MLRLDLGRAHPEQRRLIRDRMADLLNRYPFVPLRLVTVYEPRSDADRSMGWTGRDGDVHLNAHWFSQPPSRLDDASHACVEVPIGPRTMLWHGLMVDEPAHVLTHEFGHVMGGAVRGWDEWAGAGWRAATANPELAVAGYALASPDEWSAEAFAAVEMGVAPPALVRALRDLLDRGVQR